MNRFFDLLQQSVIVSGVLAVSVWGAIIYLAIAGQPIPDILYFGGAAIIGFFFGSKTGKESERIRARLEEKE